MKYFQHNSLSMKDDKMMELFLKFGHSGTGLFWDIIEKLAYAEKPLKISILKKDTFSTKKDDKIWDFLFEIQLLFIQDSTEVYSKTLQNYIGSYEYSKEKTKGRVSKHRDNKEDKKNVTRYTSNCNTNVTGIEERIENKNKSIDIQKSNFDFSESEFIEDQERQNKLLNEFSWFWTTYQKNRNESGTKFQFMRISEQELELIKSHLPRYVASTPDKNFRKDPANYLTSKEFLNEVIAPKKPEIDPASVYVRPQRKVTA